MEVFYSGAIQGNRDRGERAHVHRAFIDCIIRLGHNVFSEHPASSNKEETAALLEKSIGPLPPAGIERTKHVRRKLIEGIEGDIQAAIFELTVPSLGVGDEFAHAYLRPRMGLSAIPMLGLNEEGYWSSGLSSMIRGIDPNGFPNFRLESYKTIEEGCRHIEKFLRETQ